MRVTGKLQVDILEFEQEQQLRNDLEQRNHQADVERAKDLKFKYIYTI